VTMKSLDDLGAVREAIERRSGTGPVLIDIRLDPAHVPPSF